MKKRLSSVVFKGTAEQREKLDKHIEELRGVKGCLMPIMQEAQTIYGYLPKEVQIYIAEKLEIPAEEVYGVATFYSMFNLSPKGKYQISVCLGTACYVKGSKDILDKICQILDIKPGECTPDGLFSIEACRCIGACGLAPVMMVNDTDVYGRLKVSEVEEIIEKYKNREKREENENMG
ncbi:MAG: NAD(P)H-dependent oxidoreductase subunit E [Clostridia bacterium]|nr:NAD(P)H-dependent oxidoreductase subunit E [Clostridia bacterium]